jgi:hypothetical protein
MSKQAKEGGGPYGPEVGGGPYDDRGDAHDTIILNIGDGG